MFMPFCVCVPRLKLEKYILTKITKQKQMKRKRETGLATITSNPKFDGPTDA